MTHEDAVAIIVALNAIRTTIASDSLCLGLVIFQRHMRSDWEA